MLIVRRSHGCASPFVRYAAAYLLAIVAVFYGTMKKVRLLHGLLWTYDQYAVLSRLSWTKHFGEKMATAVRHLRKQPVCVLVKTDEVGASLIPSDPFLLIRSLSKRMRADQCALP